MCIANKPKDVTRQDLKNAYLCIVYSKEAIRYLPIYLSWSNKAQTAGKKQWICNVVFGRFLSSEPRFGPKNRSKYKIWILNTPGSRWKWLNKPKHQLHTFKLHITILTKAIENQQFWKTDFGRFLVFWAQIWPKFGPKIGPNIKFDLWLPQRVPRNGLKPNLTESDFLWPIQ